MPPSGYETFKPAATVKTVFTPFASSIFLSYAAVQSPNHKILLFSSII